jgi:hypothetical protein
LATATAHVGVHMIHSITNVLKGNAGQLVTAMMIAMTETATQQTLV